MTGARITVGDADCLVTRSGYTGEDGFEISMPAAQAEWLARELLAHGAWRLSASARATPCASRRAYAAMVTTSTPPPRQSKRGLLGRSPRSDAGVSKERRQSGSPPCGFLGGEVILGQLRDGAPRRRVGLLPVGRAPVREGTELTDADGDPVGKVTSGGYGPTLGRPVAMGHVAAAQAEPQTELQALVRGKPHPVTVVGLPFVEHRYHKNR
jgi:aminomethyltransferase